MNNISSRGYGSGSPTSTESGTIIPTPATSRASSTSRPSSTNIPPGPLNLTSLSTTSWRQPYPSVGQFAMTESEEVVAAGRDGLFHFKRVQDHASKPWSEPRPFPSGGTILNESTVSGLALYSGYESKQRKRLYLYCVSSSMLYSFYLSDKDGSSFLPDTSPPLAGYKVAGSPAVVLSSNTIGHDENSRWSLVVPCQSGGLLHTSATNHRSYDNSMSTKWRDVDHLAADLGVISAVSVTAVHKFDNCLDNPKTELVAICISRGQLNVVRGPFQFESYPSRLHWESDRGRLRWEGKTPTRILHPGEVTGNPALITDGTYHGKTQLDLLVPSAEGGIFHFVCTESAPNEWHMVGRVGFPQSIPPATCLSFHSRSGAYKRRELFALVQTCGRLYHVKISNGEFPWYNARLNPIIHPGPFTE